jgi:hypothetical protein
MTRQLNWKEMTLLISLLAIFTAAQAEVTYCPNHSRADAWFISVIFGVINAVIGGTFASMASSSRTL